jgi:hypothetical protein
MKNSVNAGIGFGVFMSAWFIVAAILIDKQDIVPGILTGLASGLISGLLFGLSIHFFGKKVDKLVQIDLLPGETLLFQTKANHFKGIEGVGGKLSLTDQRLVFRSHALNIQSHVLNIPLQNIGHVERYKTIGLINNGLKITAEGKTEKFVVDKAEEWLSRLGKTISTPA